jgi:hypothetical protein
MVHEAVWMNFTNIMLSERGQHKEIYTYILCKIQTGKTQLVEVQATVTLRKVTVILLVQVVVSSV